MNRLLLGLSAAITLIPAVSASALTASGSSAYEGASPDGSHVYYLTQGAHVPGDLDGTADLYVRAGGQTALVSDGARDDSPGFDRASTDGSVVFFETPARLTSQDTDDGYDTYARTQNGLQLITRTPSSDPESMAGATPDGSIAYITTSEQLTPADTDVFGDVYAVATANGEAELMSPGTPSAGVTFAGAAATGWRVFIQTAEPLVAGDTDVRNDIYFVEGGQLMGRASEGNGDHHAYARRVAEDGSAVVFQTSEALVAEDTDTQSDLYEAGPSGLDLRTPSPNAAGTAKGVTLSAASPDASRLVFRTTEPLTGADTDSASDLYASVGTTVTLLSGTGSSPVDLADASSLATVVIFGSADKLLGTDTDASVDLYRASSSGTLTHVNPTNGAGDVNGGRISPNGNVIAFDTTEAFAATDGDTLRDVFVRFPTVKHANVRIAESDAGPLGHANVRDVTGAGWTIFETDERLSPDDHNHGSDVYAYLGSQLVLVSVDTAAPETTLTGVAAAAAPDTALAGSLYASEPGRFECRVDDADWAECPNEWAIGALPAGTHTLRARAIDTSGNADPTPAEAVVEVTGPQAGTTEQPVQPVVESVTTSATADRTAPRIGRARVARKGRRLVVAFVMSEVATVRIVVQRKKAGRWVRVKARTVAGHLGRHTVRMRVATLRPGMRVAISARDAAGNRARPARVRIRRQALSLRG